MSKAASDEERREDEDCANALTKKLSRVAVGAYESGAPSDSEEHERALREAVHSIRAEQPGLVAKQVHAALQERGEQWASTTISEVKRMCSKLAKVEVQLNLSGAGTPEKAAEQLDKVLSDPLTRNAEAMKVARPGLPTNSTTLQRGDRLGTAAERGDTQQVVKLLKKGVDPNYQNGASGVTPLGVACERGHASVVRALLLARASPEISTREGYRPIHIASQFGRCARVRVRVRVRPTTLAVARALTLTLAATQARLHRAARVPGQGRRERALPAAGHLPPAARRQLQPHRVRAAAPLRQGAP